MNVLEKSARGVFWVFLEGSGRQLISLAVLAVLVRVLRPADFGLFAMAAASARLANLLQASGFTSAIIQRETIEPGHLDTAFWANMLISCTLAIGLWGSAELVAAFFREPSLIDIVRWMSLMPILAGLSQVQTQILSRSMRFGSLAARALVASPISGLLAVGAALAGWGVWSLVIRVLAQQALTAAMCWRVSSWRPKLTFSYRHASELFTFGASMMGANLVNFIRKEGATAIIGRALGATELGYYNMAFRICELIKDTLVVGVGRVAYPAFARLQKDPPALRDAYLGAVRFASITAVPVFAGIIAIGPFAVPTLFGETWMLGVVVLQILSLQGIIEALSQHNPTILVAAGRPELRMYATAIAAATGFFMALIAVRWGINAVAVTYLIEACLLAVLTWRFARKVIPVKFSMVWSSVWVAAAAGLVMFMGVVGLAYLLENLSIQALTPRAFVWVRLVVLVLCGMGLFVGTLVLIEPRVVDDARSALRAAKKRNA